MSSESNNLNRKVQVGTDLVFVVDSSPQGGYWEGVEIELQVYDHEVMPETLEAALALIEEDCKTHPKLTQLFKAEKDKTNDPVAKVLGASKAYDAPEANALKRRKKIKTK